jgi:hypothetical protein
MSPLVFVLPLLCLIMLVVRVAMRGLPPRTRFAWVSFLSTLLTISGTFTSIAAVLAVSFRCRSGIPARNGAVLRMYARRSGLGHPGTKNVLQPAGT